VTAKPKRRWFQFTLRSLLILMLVISFGLGWFAHQLRLARNRQVAIAECDAAGIYVYQYEPTDLGKVLRGWPGLDNWVRVRLGDSLLSTPSAVSAFEVPGDRVEFLHSRLKLFPSLKTINLGSADEETAATMREDFPDVDIVMGFFK